MARTTFTAVINGVEIKRTTTTDRIYTHAVVRVSNDGKLVESLSFASRYDLAVKASKQFVERFMLHRNECAKRGVTFEDYEQSPKNPDYVYIPAKLQIVPVSVKNKATK